MRKIAIIGSSIAGSSLAYLLARAGCEVRVFEQKSQADTGRKVCANVVTSDFVKITRNLGLNEKGIKGIIKNRFNRAIFFSERNSAEFPVDDYEIDRNKLINLFIKKAEDAGAKFYFKTEFLDFKEQENGHEITLKKNGKIKRERADYVVGADGAFSKVARKIGLKDKRKFWLATQARINKIPSENERKRYFIFFGSKFGFYSYIYPSKEYFTIGTVSMLEQKGKFDEFLKYLRVKGIKKKEAALIPIYNPTVKFRKGNILIIGDAACMTKFTGGGIIPALKAAAWASNVILGKKTKILRKLKQELFLHYLIHRGLRKFSDRDFDKYLEIAKDMEIISRVKSRESVKRWAFKVARKKPELIRLLPKLI